jgi:hypothetical protein
MQLLTKSRVSLNEYETKLQRLIQDFQVVMDTKFSICDAIVTINKLSKQYIDVYGTIHDSFQPYPNERHRCRPNLIPRQKVIKRTHAKNMLHRRAQIFQSLRRLYRMTEPAPPTISNKKPRQRKANLQRRRARGIQIADSVWLEKVLV